MLMSLETLRETGLAQPGSLIDWRYRVRQDATDAPLKQTDKAFVDRLDTAGFQVRDRSDPAPASASRLTGCRISSPSSALPRF
ncbi:MAG: hypothetical protein HC869_01510 [Rhodospirillales bacterium]|nr:hypothetical protein [Rhodospirillales bacterium]